jgi:hypothetical protein
MDIVAHQRQSPHLAARRRDGDLAKATLAAIARQTGIKLK